MTNKLPQHEIGLLNALHGLPEKLNLMQQARANIPNIRSIGDIQRWATEFRTILNDMLSDAYRTVAWHADAILQLTNDRRLLALVEKLGKLTAAEIDDLRDYAAHLQTVSDLPEFLIGSVKWAGAAIAAVVRRQQIVAATAELENYLAA